MPVDVKMGTVDIAEKCPEDFFRKIGVVPVEIKNLSLMKNLRQGAMTFPPSRSLRPTSHKQTEKIQTTVPFCCNLKSLLVTSLVLK